MKWYKVTYNFGVTDAENPIEAAKKCYDAIKDDSLLFDIQEVNADNHEPTGTPVMVDLDMVHQNECNEFAVDFEPFTEQEIITPITEERTAIF